MTREKAIEILKEIIDEGWLISDFEKCVAIDACEMAIQALEKETFINKPCVSDGVCEHDKMQMLENLRTEINSLHNGCGLFNDGVDASLKIIDKYKNGEQK